MSRFKTIGEIALKGYGRVLICAGRYRHGGQIAIALIDARSFELIASLSTNLAAAGAEIASDTFAVKVWSENAGLAAPLLASGLFEDTGRRIVTGFVEAPIWRIKDPEHIPPLERGHERERQ